MTMRLFREKSDDDDEAEDIPGNSSSEAWSVDTTQGSSLLDMMKETIHDIRTRPHPRLIYESLLPQYVTKRQYQIR